MKSTFLLSTICLFFLCLATALSIPTRPKENTDHQLKIFQLGEPTSETMFELQQQERLLLSSMLLTNKLSMNQKVRLVSELKRLDEEFTRDKVFRYTVDPHPLRK